MGESGDNGNNEDNENTQPSFVQQNCPVTTRNTSIKLGLTFDHIGLRIDVYSNYSCLYCFADQTIPALLGIITNPIFMIITSIFDVQVFW